MGGVQDKTVSLFKTNSTKNDCKSAHVKNVYDDGKKPRNLKLKALSEHWIIRNTKILFEQETDYYRLVRVVIFIATIILNKKVMVIEIKDYQSNNALMKLNQAWKLS